jgi:excisionase family DNA binding protein
MNRLAGNMNGVSQESVTPRSVRALAQCEPLIDAVQAAELLNVHPKTVKRLAAEGRIPAMKIGKLWRFLPSALDTWMRSQIQCAGHPCSVRERIK